MKYFCRRSKQNRTKYVEHNAVASCLHYSPRVGKRTVQCCPGFVLLCVTLYKVFFLDAFCIQWRAIISFHHVWVLSHRTFSLMSRFTGGLTDFFTHQNGISKSVIRVMGWKPLAIVGFLVIFIFVLGMLLVDMISNKHTGIVFRKYVHLLQKQCIT